MAYTINGLQLYSISFTHYCGTLLFSLQSWHASQCVALAHGYRIAASRYADEPVGVVRVSAQLA